MDNAWMLTGNIRAITLCNDALRALTIRSVCH